MRSKQTQKHFTAQNPTSAEDGQSGREIFGKLTSGLFRLFLVVCLPLTMFAQNPIAGNQGFQILTEGNFTFTGYTHVHGALGIGGNLTLNCSGVLAEVCMDGVSSYVFPGDGTTSTGLLVKGGVTWTNGGAKVMGGKYMHIGNSTGCIQSDNGVNNVTQVLPTGGSYNQARRIEGALDQTPTPSPFQAVSFDFTSLFNGYRATSQSLAACTNNVQLYNASNVAISGNNVSTAQNVQINSLANGVNVLNLTPAALNNITELKFNAGALPSATKLLLINVPISANYVWNNRNMPGLSGSLHGAYVFWNFSGNTSYNLTINTASLIIGTIFAPNHNLIKTGTGDIDGGMFAKSMVLGVGEIHLFNFTSNLPGCGPTENCINGIDDDSDGLVDCADPSCPCYSCTTTTFFTETFGTGGRTSHPYTNYCYEDGTGNDCMEYSPSVQINDGEYAVAQAPKPTSSNHDWTTDGDHTGDPSGRLMVVNADIEPGEFYRRTISGVVPNVDVTVDLWLRNTILPGYNILKPNVTFKLETTSGVTLGTVSSGDIPEDNTWHNYLLNVSPGNNTSVVVVLVNNGPGGTGNDLGLDDIVAKQILLPAAPTVTATCANPTSTVTVSAPLGASFQYSLNGTTYQASPTFTGVATGTYGVRVRNIQTGCVSNATSLTVVSLPTISTQPTGGTICSGFSRSLSVTASGVTSYQWQISTDNVSFTDIAGATSSSYNTGNLTATRYYQVRVSNGASCSVTSSKVTVTVQVCAENCSNGLDDDGDGLIDGADGDCMTFCPTGSLTLERWTGISGSTVSNLTSNAAYPNSPNFTGTISSFDGPDNVADNFGTRVRGYIQPTVTGTYSFNLTGDDDCALYLSTNVQPASKVLIASFSGYTGTAEYTKYASQTSANINLVAGQKYYVELLQKESGGGDHFQVYWKTPASSTWTIVPGANLRPFGCTEICNNSLDDDGDGLVDCADSNCAATAPTITASAATVCAGTSTTLTATGAGAFLWSTGASTAAIVVVPTTTTTYTVTLTATGGCTATVSRTITVNALPTASITGASTLCSGQTGSITASGGTSYLWSTGSTTATLTGAPTSTATYIVTVTNASGCTATASRTVTVNPSPIANAGSNMTVCSGTSINLVGSATSGALPYAFNWSNGLGAGATHTVVANANIIYTLTVTDNIGCTSVAQASITGSTLPTANAGSDATICQGQQTVLTATGSGAPAPYSFAWSNGFNGASQTVSPSATTTFTVTVTSSNGCFATDQKVVTVQSCVEVCNNGLDDDADGFTDCADTDCGPSANAGSDITICPGNTALLSVGVTGGSSPYSYNWSNGLGAGATKTVSPTVSTTYTVTVTSASGCTSTDQIAVNVLPCSENCTNGIDDDGDGLVDCADPDCAGVTAPVLTNDNYTTCPGMTFSERATYNDVNLNNPLYSIVANPAHGTVTIDWTGKFTYIPNGFDCLTDQFTYEACNQSTGCCDQAVVTIVLGDTQAPILTNIPADLTINCDDVVPPAQVVTGFDQCPGIFMDFEEVSSQNYVGACGSYTITRTWSATDFCGNTVTDEQKITVVDLTKPEIFNVHTTTDGSKLLAGVAQRVTHDWKYIRFPITFKGMPVVLATVSTNADIKPVAVQLRNISKQGFEMKLREEEAADGSHGNENVSWVAVEAGQSDQGMIWEAGTLANVNHLLDTINFKQAYAAAPVFLSSVITTAQTDPGTIRTTALSGASAHLFVQEETSADAETDHMNETIGYFALADGSAMVDEKGHTIGEAGKISLTHAWTTITLANTYTKPVVIIGSVSNQDAQPVTVRVRNVASNRFELRLQEWDYQDGNHSLETVNWMVVEGSVPGNQNFYCEGGSADLVPQVNIFALDNCDDLVEFGHSQDAQIQPDGLVNNHIWTAIDDCGNTQLLTRNDTCIVAAVKVKAKLFGAITGTGTTNLMRDNLRTQAMLPIVEPYSEMSSYPHVATIHPKVKICHHPGQADQAAMEIPASELQEHLAHGDIVGSCGLPPAPLPTGVVSAEFRTIADGDWNNPAIWLGGVYPQNENIISKTVSIEHDVKLLNSSLFLKNNTKLYITNGSLTMPNGGIRLQNSSLYARHASLNINGELYSWSGTCRIDMKDCTVKVGGQFTNESGIRRLENVCLEVANDFKCGYTTGVDSLFNMTATVNGVVRSFNSGKMHAQNCKFRLPNGNFIVELGSKLSGSGLKLLLENGSLLNLGQLSAVIDQFCIAGSISLPLINLPAVENCSNLTDFFLSCSPDNVVQEDDSTGSEEEDEVNVGPLAAGVGVMNPVLLQETGASAIVDWLVLELRNPVNAAEIKGYATVVLRRDGSITTEEGDSIIIFNKLQEGDYFVSIRHRNHLGLMTEFPEFLSIIDPPMIDFSDLAFPVKGGINAGRSFNGKRYLWGGDLNGDGKVVYQGPNNDVFRLFVRILEDQGNVENLANYIVPGYEHADFNMDGKVIYQGPNNDRSPLLTFTILSHGGNGNMLANYIALDFIP